MKYVLWILIGLAGLGLIFVVLPAIVSYFAAFHRRKGRSFDELDLTGTPYEPFREQISEGIAYFKAKEMERVEIRSADGLMLRGYYLDAGSEKTCIFVHGWNTTPFSNFGTPGRFLYEELKFNLLFIHQRAFGESEGLLHSMGLKERMDVRSWIRFADQRGADEILLYGASMGAETLGLGADSFKNKKVRAMVMDCGFISPRSQMELQAKAYHMPAALAAGSARIMAKILLRVDLYEEVPDHLKKCDIPVFFIHAKQDDVVPVADTEQNYEACASPKMKLITEQGGHATAFIAGGKKAKDMLRTFIEVNFEA